jgi:hypothetical protein
MPKRFRQIDEGWIRCVAGLLALGLLGLVVFSVAGSGDYNADAAANGDNVAPGIGALLHGSVGGYFARQPIIGLTSILLRLPFSALAAALGGNALGIYKFGAVACLLPLALAAAWLIGAPGLPLKARVLRLLAVIAVIQSPILEAAVELGHPEDVLAAVLASAAAVMAARGHARSAATLLGLSIGAKEWALVALVPVMIALPGRRRKVAAIVGLFVVVLVGLPWLADPAAFERALDVERGARYLSPLSPLWPVGVPISLIGGGYVAAGRALPWGLTRSSASLGLLVVAGLIAVVWYLRLRRRGAVFNPIGLLALLGALPCVCDTVDQRYYWLSLLLPLAAWEGTENRLPIGTVFVSLLVGAAYGAMGHVPSNLIYAGTLVAEAGVIGYVARYTARGKRDDGSLALQPSTKIGLPRPSPSRLPSLPQ